MIEEGEVEIAGKTFGLDESFGEIALLRDVPRTASVAARTDVLLRAIGREDFVEAVASHDPAAAAADAVVSTRLAGAPA